MLYAPFKVTAKATAGARDGMVYAQHLFFFLLHNTINCILTHNAVDYDGNT